MLESALFTNEENDDKTLEMASAKDLQRKNSLLQKFYNLSISRKTGIIPWFSLIALGLIVGAGGLILRNSLISQVLTAS